MLRPPPLVRRCAVCCSVIRKKIFLSPVAISFETEPELKYIIIELTREAVLPGILPLPVNNLERNVLEFKKIEGVQRRFDHAH